MSLRVRVDTKGNYRAIFLDGNILRSKLYQSMRAGTPDTPESEEVSIVSSLGVDYSGIVEKAKDIWGTLPAHRRPFSILLSEMGESTKHTDWISFVRAVHSLDIAVHYNTNGMYLSPDIVKATEDYCAGVTLFYYSHMPVTFTAAVDKIGKIPDILFNCAITVNTSSALTNVKDLFNKYKDVFDFFIISPYSVPMVTSSSETESAWKDLLLWVGLLPEERRSQFYFSPMSKSLLEKHKEIFPMVLYDPEVFHGYRMLDDSYNVLRNSRFVLTPKSSTL